MQTTRRQFIKSSVCSAIGIGLTRALSMAVTETKSIPIAFQLWAVRGEFTRSVPATLKALAQIGYKAVEFWGYGSTFLNVASASAKMKTEKGIGELADLLNQRAVECRAHRMTVGYHSHGFDFEKINGRFAWELLFGRLQPEVNMQLDVGNCLDGKGDPIAVLKQFPGRTRSIHIKEHGDKTFESDLYKEVFRLCETVSRTKWYIVEMGGPDGNGFDVPGQAPEKLHR